LDKAEAIYFEKDLEWMIPRQFVTDCSC